MPVVSRYTEETLRPFLVTALGDIATLFGWTASHPQIDAALVDTTRLLGLTDVANATDAAQVERLATVAALRRAKITAAAWYDQRLENGQEYKRGQVQKMVAAALLEAEIAATSDLPEYQITRDVFVGPSADPYSYYPDEWRVLP